MKAKPSYLLVYLSGFRENGETEYTENLSNIGFENDELEKINALKVGQFYKSVTPTTTLLVFRLVNSGIVGIDGTPIPKPLLSKSDAARNLAVFAHG